MSRNPERTRIARLDAGQADFDARLEALTAWDASLDAGVMDVVNRILEDVLGRGDAALVEYTRRFDGLEAETAVDLEIPLDECRAALEALDASARESLAFAAERIRAYHAHQRLPGFDYRDPAGHRLGQRVVPLARVGVYAPGGKASYPSTVLMCVVPARVAGVGEIVLVTPAARGELNPWVLAAAAVAGVDRVFAVGGAQAIGALAFGTGTVPRVDKIVGPGGAFVAAAKKQVFGPVGIDMVAGPSEILVLADDAAPVPLLVADLFSQAEHDESAQALLVTPSATLADRVHDEIDRQLAQAPRRAVIEQSLGDRGALITCRDLDQAVAIANRVAPEHLELMVSGAQALVERLDTAGAVFVGPGTGEVLGDYVAGPSHVLPTAGTGRWASPLSVYDFQKRISVIEVGAAGLPELARHADRLARAEGLHAHAAAARMRAGTNEQE